MADQNPKDLVKHLRTIHFTLLAVCLGAVVVVLSPGPLSVSKALEQLDQAITIQKNWQADWIKQAASGVAAPHGECWNRHMPDGDLVHIGNEHFQIEIGRKWDVSLPTIAGIIARRNIDEFPTLRSPVTLADFREIWNSSGSLICPTDDLNPVTGALVRGWDSNTNTFVNGNKNWNLKVESGGVPGAPSKKVFDWIAVFPSANGDDLSYSSALFETTPERWRWVVPMTSSPRVVRRPFFIRTAIIAEHTQYGLKNKDFNAAFPDLSLATVANSELSLDHLQSILQNEEGATKDNFEAFGLKFPVQATRRWAIILIIVIQLYFWIHFREFQRLGQPECDMAWIGAYKQWPARVLSIITLVLVPAVVTVFLSYWSEEGATNHWLQGFAVALSTCMALLTAYSFRKGATASTRT